MRGERIAAPIFALLIVFSGVGGGLAPVGTVAAADTECDTIDALWYDIVNVGDWKLAGGGCNEDVKTVQAQENLQQKLDLNQMAKGAYEGRQPLFIKMSNGVDTSGSVVSMRARARMVDMIKNGTTNATKIRNEVHEEINDYYSPRQVTLVETYRAHMEQTRYVGYTVANDSDISNSFLFVQHNNFAEVRHVGWNKSAEGNVTNTTVNGTTVKIPFIAPRMQEDSTGVNGTGEWGMFHTEEPKFDGSTWPQGIENDIRIKRVENSTTTLADYGTAINRTQYEQAWLSIEAEAERMRSNYDLTYINSIITDVETGKLDTSEMVTPEMLVQEFGAESDETGYLGYQVAMTSFLGVESQNDLNASVEITADSAKVVSGPYFDNGSNVSTTGYSGEGLIFAEVPPSGNFTVGQTYNATTLSGPVWFVNATSGRRVALSGDFTIVSATDQAGDNISSVEMDPKNAEVYNADEFVNETQEQQQVRIQIEREYQPAGGTGGGGGGGSSNPLSGLLGPLASLLGIGTGATMLVLIGGGLVAFRVYTP